MNANNVDTGQKIAGAVAAAFAFAWLACLIMQFHQHAWILDEAGRPVVTDFLEVWVAGRTTLKGAAAAAYDPVLHHTAQETAVGHAFHGYLWWHYPPVVLFLAAALALLPYMAAFLVWVSSTLALYTATIAAIAKTRFAALFACAMPPVLANAIAGQNGFFTASLIGLALLNLETRPLLAGVFVGLLTYKPQFGILFPLILAVGGKWRAICSATVVAVFAVLLPFAVFGAEPLLAFLHYLPKANDSLLVHGAAGWNKLQTIYGVLRWIGFGNVTASAAQTMTCLSAAATVVFLWRTKVSFELKAAALATAVLFATPYTYMYDLPILAVTFAFLYRERRFDMFELTTFAFTNFCLLAFAAFVIPTGYLAAVAVATIVIRRAWTFEGTGAQRTTAFQGAA